MHCTLCAGRKVSYLPLVLTKHFEPNDPLKYFGLGHRLVRQRGATRDIVQAIAIVGSFDFHNSEDAIRGYEREFVNLDQRWSKCSICPGQVKSVLKFGIWTSFHLDLGVPSSSLATTLGPQHTT